MCGLTVIVAPDPAPLGALARAMTAAVAHRGPDDEGYVLFPSDRGPALVAGGDHTAAACYGDGALYSPKAAPGALLHFPGRVAMGHRRLSIIDLSIAGHQPMCSA